MRQDAAAGVDGVTWEMYGEGLEERLPDLHRRLHSGGDCRAPPVRRVEIPEPDGGTRPLGIAALEGKIVQKAVVDTIPVPVHQPEFPGFSYGFRPGRGAHNALDALTVGTGRRKVNRVVDADISKFLDSVDRDQTVRFLEHRIGDRRLIRLITKWLNAGVMDGGNWTGTGAGTPQGANVSPVLANIYLHYVLDLRVHRFWRRRKAAGDVIIVRQSDDFVVGFQHRREAERFMDDLRERLARFGLGMHPEKTRLIEFGRFAEASRKKRRQGKPETFGFLGMTHFCDRTRKGRFRVGRRPSRKRVRRTLAKIGQALRRRWHEDWHEVARWLGRVISGWLNHFAVPGTIRRLQAFVRAVRRKLPPALRRRWRKDRTDWSAVDLLTAWHWPKPSIRHPWPGQRLVV